MNLIVADTGPINYLVQIGAVTILPVLAETVILPPAVMLELRADGAPPEVRAWGQLLPGWVRVEVPAELIPPDPSLSLADRVAISLAVEKRLLLVIDDRRARDIAKGYGLVTIGTLGILEAAAAANLISLPEALERLRRTSIFLSSLHIDQALDRDSVRRMKSRT